MAFPDESDDDVAEDVEAGVLASTEFDWSVTPPSLAVVRTLSQASDVDPLALSSDQPVPLHDYVDPDALDALVGDGDDDSVTVTLSLDGCDVEIRDSDVVVSRSSTDLG